MKIFERMQNLGVDGTLPEEQYAKVRLTNLFLVIMLAAIPSYFGLFFYFDLTEYCWGFFFPLLIYPIGLIGASIGRFVLSRHCLMLGFLSGIVYFLLLFGPGMGVEMFFFVVIGLSYLINDRSSPCFTYLYAFACLAAMVVGYMDWSWFGPVLTSEVRFYLTVAMAPMTLVLVFVMIKTFNDNITNNLEKIKRQKTDLENKNKELNQFAYIVSHDLKSPLRVMNSFVGLIQDKHRHELSEEAVKYFSFVSDKAERMELLITEILNYVNSTSSANKVEEFQISTLMVDVKTNLIVPDNIKLKWIGAEFEMVTSFTRLFQVLSNLIGNAIKYHNKDGGWVEVNAQQYADNHLKFTIRDNGPGIDPKYHDRIFRFLERLDSSDAEGTGIGLAIVKKLVESSGGEIGLDSKLGEGSCFWFTWPLREVQA